MSAVIYDLFKEDPFTGIKLPNVHAPQEFWVTLRDYEAQPGYYAAGVVAVFLKRHEAVAWISQQEQPGNYFIEHVPEMKPQRRA